MYVNTETGEYPVSEAQIRERHPEWCYPIPFAPCDGYAYPLPESRPPFNRLTHRLEAFVFKQEVEGEEDHWTQDWTAVPLSAAEIAQLLTAEKARLAEQATQKRWDVETGGITLSGGLRIDTGRTDQDSITRVLVNAQAAGITEVRFKAASGWVTLSIDELRQIASAVARHVQTCYDSEHAHHVAIDALDQLAEAAAYDLSAGWPA